MVTMMIAFDAGARRDPAGKAGLASLTASCLTLGTKELSATQFNQKVDFMGSSISVAAGSDYAQASFTSLKKYQDDTLRLLAAALTTPALSDAEITRKRDEHVADIKAQEEQPGYVAGVTFRKKLFGDHPYGHPSEGTAESVAKLTPQDVRDFYHAQYKIGSAVIAVVGDVKVSEVQARLEKAPASSAARTQRPARNSSGADRPQRRAGDAHPGLRRHRAFRPGLLSRAGDELHPGRRRFRLAPDEDRAQQGRPGLWNLQRIRGGQISRLLLGQYADQKQEFQRGAAAHPGTIARHAGAYGV
jgi:hypothetical protein